MAKMTKLFSMALLCLWVQTSVGQTYTHKPINVSIATNSNGYYEYLPAGYNPTGTKTYPLILFIHGGGDVGDGSPVQLANLLKVGIPQLIDQGRFPSAVTVNNKAYSFIVISPQFTHFPENHRNTDRWRGVAYIQQALDYAVSHYKVDLNRIYVTGVSLGGALTFDYAGHSTANANRVAAILPIAAATNPIPGQASNIANTDLPVWATHNNGDVISFAADTRAYVDQINAVVPAPSPLAKATIFPTGGHDAWTRTYDPTFTEQGLNVYQWMLQYQRSVVEEVVLPVKLTDYKARLLPTGAVSIQWTTADELDNRHFTLERSADGVTFSPLHVATAANTGRTYSYTDAAPLTGNNYYRLSQTDLNGKVTFLGTERVVVDRAKVAVTLSPNPAKDQLRVRVAGGPQGVWTVSIVDLQGKTVQQWTASQAHSDWNQAFSVASLPAGTYLVRLKNGQFESSEQFVKN